MKTIAIIPFTLVVLALASPIAAIAAAQPLAANEIRALPDAIREAASYTWTASISAPEDTAQRPLSTISIEGQTEKDGPTALTVRFGDRTIHGYLKGNKAYVTSTNTNWRDVPEMRKWESPGMFMDRIIRGITPPAKQIAQLTFSAADLQNAGDDTISGNLVESRAKALLENQGPGGKRTSEGKATTATGNVKFWTKDGAVTKYELTLRGSVLPQQRGGV